MVLVVVEVLVVVGIVEYVMAIVPGQSLNMKLLLAPELIQTSYEKEIEW